MNLQSCSRFIFFFYLLLKLNEREPSKLQTNDPVCLTCKLIYGTVYCIHIKHFL